MHLFKNSKFPKFIVVTGGVLSGLGKGVAAASIGNLLASKYKVIAIKCDGYLNVDPGTMNPIEHGEVFVLDDGGEVDMDFGHYERFLNITTKFEWNITMGKVYREVLDNERKGNYLGKTVQLIPHVTDVIKKRFYDIAKKEKADIVLIEIGGTVGDMENELYLEAVKQLRQEVGNKNITFVHLTYIPIPSGVNEQKSKPTQQSVKELNERGIMPHIIIGRCSEFIEPHIKEKIARFCNVRPEAVISGVDVPYVYMIPLVFQKEGIVDTLEKRLDIKIRPKTERWKELTDNLLKDKQKKRVTIAICGKYTALQDSYASIIEALLHCEAHLNCRVSLKWLETSDITNEHDAKKNLDGVDGIIVPGGFGSRGTEGKIRVIKHARENNIPFLGLCLGLQLAVVEFARNKCGLKGANSTEINPRTPFPVIDILEEQKKITDKGGTMRLGAYTAYIKKGSKVNKIYNSTIVSERHRHRYEVNPEFHEVLKLNGLVISGMDKSKTLAEFIEIPKHKYFVATQAHPELKSSLLKPAPLFRELVRACLKK